MWCLFLATIYGDDMPSNGHPPRIPWDGQRTAAARVVTHLVESSPKYQEEWKRFADKLDNQKG
eukprot:2565508-Pyramimonas_sp.AAC.1